MAVHSWSNLPAQLSTALSKLDKALNSDAQLLAFTQTEAITKALTFGIKAAGSDETVLVTVGKSNGSVSVGHYRDATFTLCALPEQWQSFYEPIPKAPFQSYWGMMGQNIHQEGVEVLGDQDVYIQCTHIWRRVLELSHTALCGPIDEDEQQLPEEDYIVGRYIYVSPPVWGRVKLFYEQSGEGTQDIIFLHTAGSDGRQYHGVMNDPRMRARCNMIAFDLPGHGRSFPSEFQIPGRHTNTEDSYVGCIKEVIRALKLNKPIVCGASMAGHVCLAVAIRAEEVGAGGTIPCQGFVSRCRGREVKLMIPQLRAPRYASPNVGPFSFCQPKPF